ncbi:30S ribosome-binding factor RbfA [Aestuariibacter sp. A3R04]|uniref:30S ribosome-binding factor RbfA n=1 Tax=Aestuariibacter sp. A3R04 TaxID=2841571 RepID=UPI001C09C78C|nr:30S ribosome-binding factor RbfA [Aestuariibacter sp. A3R04]MBU3023177.1 30S ribosome-binding factor RbfA [Aestuariibacter sp. A3R04]
MAREFSRTDRVGQQVHKEVASILQNEYKHRIGDMPLITVSDVEVSRDLAHAKIYVTIYGAEEADAKAHTKQLEENKGFVRSLLAKRLRMRSVPHLHFFRDESLTEGIRIANLVADTIAKDEEKNKQRDEEQD